MEHAMTKSKIATVLAALTLAGALTVSGGQAQAHPHHHHFGPGLGFGIAAGTLIGIAAANAYAEPVYSDCHYVRRYDRWGHPYVITVCDED
jgi:hypothetical protein